MSALVCHQRDAVEQEEDVEDVEDVEKDETELKELARERAGELEEDSSVRAEETESSLSETYETFARAGQFWTDALPALSAKLARRLFLRRPPRRVRLGSLCIVAESMEGMFRSGANAVGCCLSARSQCKPEFLAAGGVL